MELVIIALVGTALLMAAELREFVMGGRSISATAESSALRSALSTQASDAESEAKKIEHIYDEAT
jgi:hypothetical protein